MRRLDLRTLSFDETDEARRCLDVEVDPFNFGGQQYTAEAGRVATDLLAGRVGTHLTLKLAFRTVLHGPCERCLEDVTLPASAEALEYVVDGASQGTEDGEEAYVVAHVLDADRLVRDMLAGALPPRLVCREDCRGLCPLCGANLNEAGPEHGHRGP